MNRHTLWLSAALAGALTVAAAAQAAPDTKEQFQRRYTELRGAMAAHDQAALAKIITPDFTMTDVRGETHTAAEVAQMEGRRGAGRADHPRSPAGESSAPAGPAKPDTAPPRPERKTETTVLAATVSGETASVHQQLHMAMTREGDDGTPHAIDLVIVSDDSWVHHGDAWLLQKSVQKDFIVKRDGEEFMHQTAGAN